MRSACRLILVSLCLAANVLPQPFLVYSASDLNLPKIRKAIENKNSFTLPGYRAAMVYAERIVNADSRTLTLGGVSLKTGDFYVEADQLEFNWESGEGRLIGSNRLLAASGPATN